MIRVRPLTAEDLPAGLRLSQAAGWNQTEADWRRALDLGPGGCFVAEADGGEVTGTVSTCRFGAVGWVAMMLVDPAHRRRGVGRALFAQALASLEAGGAATIRLDATPMGQPLYEQFGLAQQFRLARYAGVLPAAPGPLVLRTQTAPAEQYESLLATDRHVTGTDRRSLLLRLFRERPDEVRMAAAGRHGLMAARNGARAVQLGPCLGEAGEELLLDAFRRHAGRAVLLDVPEANGRACALAEAMGLTVQRHLTRMARGPEVRERLDQFWAAFGPEKG